jgi:hypothetical protein
MLYLFSYKIRKLNCYFECNMNLVHELIYVNKNYVSHWVDKLQMGLASLVRSRFNPIGFS